MEKLLFVSRIKVFPFIFYFWISKNLSARGRVPKKKITKPLGLSYFFFWYASARAQIFGNPKIKNKK